MIVRDRPSGLEMFLLLRGSILPRILPSLLTTTLIAIVVTLTHGDLFSVKINRLDFLMMPMGDDLGQCLKDGRIDACITVSIDATLWAMTTAAAASYERIKSTPIPFSYTLLLHRTAYLYCFLLQFGLVDTLGFMTPFVVAIVAHTFFGLNALGDTDIPEPLMPIDYCLT